MPVPKFHSLPEAAAWWRAWLQGAALPLWATAGVDRRAETFHEGLTIDARPQAGPRRARVQARQVFVYAAATRAGFGERWLAVAERGYAAYRGCYRRCDGNFAVLADPSGRVLDDSPYLYEQAFTLLAAAALQEAGATEQGQLADATALMLALDERRHPTGGFVELGAHPCQANALMHLLEASMAWEALAYDGRWSALSDELAGLALARFIDPRGGFLREFFDADWRPAAGDDGRWVEPGHQFEWAWLLSRWAERRRNAEAQGAARTLYRRGLQGIDRRRGVAVNILWDDLTVRDPVARLWPQTEYLKAALRMGDEAEALNAANALVRYVDTPVRGAWRDKMLADGSFVEEPAPASSFYHVMLAVMELLDADARTDRAPAHAPDGEQAAQRRLA